MISILKLTGGPGSLQFLALAVLCGLVAFYYAPRWRRLALLWLFGVIGVYLVLALPVVSHGITARLPAVAMPESSPGAATLVVLDGDNRRGRVLTAKKLMESERPAEVWVLGDRWILDAMNEAGIDSTAYRLDGRATTTLGQMKQVSELATRADHRRVIVISSRLQAPRVAALAAAMHAPVIVIPAAVDAEPPQAGFAKYFPTYLALRVSRDALYEHAALWWYARQGWIGQPAQRATTR